MLLQEETLPVTKIKLWCMPDKKIKKIKYEENKYLNTLLFCKFSHLEIMEGSEIVIVGACPLERHNLKKKKKQKSQRMIF